MEKDYINRFSAINEYIETRLDGKERIDESGYARAANIMRGLVPSVDTFTILTAENPMNQTMSAEWNNKANADLEKQLRAGNFGYQKVGGRYGKGPEHSFFIPNISREQAMRLGFDYKQDSIVVGEKISTEKDGKTYTGMKMDMVYTYPQEKFGQVESSREVFFNVNDWKDYYSTVKGRKFHIPFYDDEFGEATWKPESGVIQKHPGMSESFIKEINEHVKMGMDNKLSGSGQWKHRGRVKNMLHEFTKKLSEKEVF